MILVNPFTGMVINANQKGCNQWTGPKCWAESHEALKKAAGIPIEFGAKASRYLSRDPRGPRIEIAEDPFTAALERPIIAHEIGHHKSGHQPVPRNYVDERQAWKWVLKNRKKLAISKRQIRQAIRTIEQLDELPRNALMTGKPEYTGYTLDENYE